MSINQLYFENGCSNLRLHILTEASEEAMCIVAYLKDDATLRLTYVLGKYRVTPIGHMTISKLELPAAVYGVCLRKQILSDHVVRIDKTYHWTNSSTCYSGYKQRTRNNKHLLQTEQWKYWKTH